MPQLEIPAHFMKVRYNGTAHPFARAAGIEEGANCQRFVYALLEHFGYAIAPMRSSELWDDQRFTRRANQMRSLDILLFNRNDDPWGAHLALYLGAGRAIHLSRAVGVPAIWELGKFERCPRYRILLGIKRPKVKVIA